MTTIIARETSHARAQQIDRMLAESNILATITFQYPGYLVRVEQRDVGRAHPLVEALRSTWARGGAAT